MREGSVPYLAVTDTSGFGGEASVRLAGTPAFLRSATGPTARSVQSRGETQPGSGQPGSAMQKPPVPVPPPAEQAALEEGAELFTGLRCRVAGGVTAQGFAPAGTL